MLTDLLKELEEISSEITNVAVSRTIRRRKEECQALQVRMAKVITDIEKGETNAAI